MTSPTRSTWQHAGHVRYSDVDDHDVVFSSCYFPGGDTMCGNASIIGQTTKARADVIRRAARAYRLSSGLVGS